MKAVLITDGKISNIIEIDKLSDVPNSLYLSDKSTLRIGDTYDKALAECGEQPAETQQIVTVTLTKPVVQSLTESDSIRVGLGGIVWLPINQPFSIKTTAEGIPDSQLMVMVERVVDGSKAVDDIRLLADIKDGQVSMKGIFKVSGNYMLRASRLNEGLARIGAQFRLDFKTVEFDAYESV